MPLIRKQIKATKQANCNQEVFYFIDKNQGHGFLSNQQLGATWIKISRTKPAHRDRFLSGELSFENYRHPSGAAQEWLTLP